MKIIQLYNRDLNPNTILPIIDQTSTLEDLLTQEERNTISESWENRISLSTKHNFKYYESTLGALYDTAQTDPNLNPIFTFKPIKFSTYYGISNSIENGTAQNFSPQVIEQSRTSAIGISITTSDGFVVIQRRGIEVLASNKYDSSASGMAVIKSEKLDFKKNILEKIKTELGIKHEDLTSFQCTGFHRVIPLYSTVQTTFKAKTKKTLEQIKQTSDPQYTNNPKRISEIIGIREQELPEFIIEHYATKEDMLGDGVVAFISAMNKTSFNKTIQELKVNGVTIQIGRLVKGSFIEDSVKVIKPSQFLPYTNR